MPLHKDRCICFEWPDGGLRDEIARRARASTATNMDTSSSSAQRFCVATTVEIKGTSLTIAARGLPSRLSADVEIPATITMRELSRGN